MEISTGIGTNSAVITLLTWVLSLVEIGSNGGTRASAGASYAAKAKAMALTTSFASLKKPSIGVPAEIGTSLLVG